MPIKRVFYCIIILIISSLQEIFVYSQKAEYLQFFSNDSVKVVKNILNKLQDYYNEGYLEASFDSIIFDSATVFTYLHLGKKFNPLTKVNFVLYKWHLKIHENS